MAVSLDSPVDTPRTGRGRRTAFTVVAVVLAVAAFVGAFGVGIIVGWFDTDMHGIHRVHDISFGILFGVLLTTALLALVRRPERKASAVLSVFAGGIAVAISALLSADGRFLAPAVFVLVGAGLLVALHPERDSILRAPARPSGPMLGIVVVGAVPLVAFALTLARLQRTGPAHDPHVSQDHWATMAAMVVGLLLFGVLASLRLPGWRITAWSAGLGVGLYGVASIVFHHFPNGAGPYPGSRGIGWGIVAILGGVAFLAVSEGAAR